MAQAPEIEPNLTPHTALNHKRFFAKKT